MLATYIVKIQGMDLILDNAQAQRMGKAGGHALPLQGLQGGSQTADPPHVSMGGAECHITIGKNRAHWYIKGHSTNCRKEESDNRRRRSPSLPREPPWSSAQGLPWPDSRFVSFP